MALFLCLSLYPQLGKASEKPFEYYMCSNKKFVRTLRIEVLKDKSCQAKYSKAGKDRMIGSGMHIESCRRFLKNVKGNLEAAGWKCRKVDAVNISAAK